MGAWVVVVVGGLGIALYTRRNSSTAVAEPTVVDNTSGDAGVGTGAVGGWVSTSPTPAGPIAVPTTNDEWGAMVENGLIARNYPANTVDGMVRKYIAGQTSNMSPAEYALLAVALATFGGPPQILPPDTGTPPVTVPPTATPSPTPVTNMYTMRVGQTMYDVEKIAHKDANTAQLLNLAINAIHYNKTHGINPWPALIPGVTLTRYPVKRSMRVYVL